MAAIVTSISIVLAVFAATIAEPVVSTTDPSDVRLQAKQIIATIRDVAMRAKDGISLDLLHQDVLDLQIRTSELLSQLPAEVSECETQAIIKMAAAGTGSHEVLTLLVAEDPLAVLSGRLSLSLSVLERVAQQLEDELSLSADVGPHLTAIIFGTNTTVTIIDTADKTVKKMASLSNDDNNNNNRVRRQLRTSLRLGGGWSVGLGGVDWRSSSGRYSFNARPTFSGFKPDGFRAGFTIRF